MVTYFPSQTNSNDSNICTTLLIREQKINNNCPSDTLISLEVICLNVEIFSAFEVLQAIYYVGNVFSYKKIKVLFSSTMLRYFVTALS